jgi:tetratricopeptide (TPR) repeat protein
LINQAGDQLSSANYQEAIEYYNQAILLKPDDKGAYISTYINRGYAHSQLKDYQRAVEDYIFIIIIIEKRDRLIKLYNLPKIMIINLKQIG